MHIRIVDKTAKPLAPAFSHRHFKAPDVVVVERLKKRVGHGLIQIGIAHANCLVVVGSVIAAQAQQIPVEQILLKAEFVIDRARHGVIGVADLRYRTGVDFIHEEEIVRVEHLAEMPVVEKQLAVCSHRERNAQAWA